MTTVEPLSVALEAALVRELVRAYEWANHARFRERLKLPVIALVEMSSRLGHWVRKGRRLELARGFVLDRPWHMVDTGSWDDEKRQLTVQWVDRAPASVWEFADLGTFPQVLRERVQASVVLADEVDLGPKRRARVVVRKELGTGALLGQTILGKGVRSSDPGVSEETRAALDRLREQVGLD